MKQIINVRKAVKVEEVPEPVCGEREVLVANVYSLISAGTERHSIEMRSKSMLALGQEMSRERPDLVAKVKKMMKSQGIIKTYKMVKERLNEPNILGYSSAGVVIEVGKDVRSIKAGDRVACGGGGYAVHAEMVRVPENLCVKVPDTVPLSQAAFTTVGAIAMQGVRRADVRVGENVVVTGLGLVGLLTAQILRASGCRVLGLDISPEKVALARKLGIDARDSGKTDAFSLVDEFSSGNGADAVIITASTSSSQPVNDALRMVRKRGKVVVVGAVGMNLQREPFYEKEGDFLISTSYGPGRYDPLYEEKGMDYPIAYVRWTERRNMESFLALVKDKKISIKPLITHVFPVEKGSEAYEVIKEGKGIGVLIEYGKEGRRIPAKRVVSISPSGGEGLRIGIIGAGNFAKAYHLPNLAKMDGARIYAVATATGTNATAIAKKYGAAYATTDYRKIIADRNVDAVVISTRHNLHASIAMEALSAGKHVFVEKPAAMNEKELDGLLSVAERSGKVFMVGLNRRFSPLVVRAKKELERSAGPVIVNYTVNAGKLPENHWIYDPVEGGGRIIGEGVHFFDTMEYLTGRKPVSVSVVSVDSVMKGVRAEDNVVITVKYDNGSLGTLTYTSTGASGYLKERIHMERDGISVDIDDFRSMEIYRPSLKRVKLKKQDKGHMGEIEAFLDAVRKGRLPVSLDEIRDSHILSFISASELKG